MITDVNGYIQHIDLTSVLYGIVIAFIVFKFAQLFLSELFKVNKIIIQNKEIIALLEEITEQLEPKSSNNNGFMYQTTTINDVEPDEEDDEFTYFKVKKDKYHY